MSFKKDKRQETIIYLALWALLFMAPVLHLSIRTAESDAFNWSEVLMVWRQYAVFFLIFLIHNHLLAPILVYRQKRTLYLSLILGIAVLFQVYQCNHRPNFGDRRPLKEMARDDRRSPMPMDRPDDDFGGPEGDFDRPMPPEHFEEPDSTFPLNDSVKIAKYDPRDYRPRPMRDMPPGMRRDMGRDMNRKDFRPPLIFGQHDIISMVILILMLGMNLAIKLYFKQRRDQKQLAELEKQNLEQQLEYLKYQINPHFFMNTLNNIHALVDIDPEKAKQTILELSKMMRFVLYEGNKKVVPVDREIAFLENYITLMKLRYTDKVRITVKTPDSLPSKEVPPLMFITFVENAFKHGVSYRQESFIDISISLDSRLVFVCRNSKIPKEEDKHGGVGLANVKQRLELIYGDLYNLDIRDEADTYTVTLSIPL